MHSCRVLLLLQVLLLCSLLSPARSLAAAAPVAAERAAREAVETCAGDDLRVIEEELLVFVGRRGMLDCLGIEPGTFPSPFGDEACGDRCRPNTWAALREGDLEAIVSGAQADRGVTRLETVRSGIHLVALAYATHTRNHLVIPGRQATLALGDGEMELLDADTLRFLARGRKTYFKEEGAFWYDAVVEGGLMIDILPTYPECLSRAEMMRRTSLDLERVQRDRICFDH